MGGICGTDLSILSHIQPPDSILQAFSSSPMILGHENVAVVDQVGPAVEKDWLGRRVCVEPTLSCAVRGIEPPCPRCQAGQFGVCENFATDGVGSAGLPPGTSIGYNRATGGSFGEYFVAHRGQLVPAPEEMSDEQAVLTDPLACSLHAVLRAGASQARRVLVYGAGMIGLGVIGCLRATGYRGQIDVLDRAGYLADLARAMGADEFLLLPHNAASRFAAIAERTGGKVHALRLGNYMLSGGYDAVFDCVGGRRSLSECLKWTAGRGQVVMVGTGCGAADLTPVWFTELDVIGAHGRGMERFEGQEIGTYPLVYKLMISGRLKTAGLLTHVFPIAEYRRAFEVASNKAVYRAVKVAFDFRPAIGR
jgi:threonine dehydrogenase-like Zn-dependent dehydrogenase